MYFNSVNGKRSVLKCEFVKCMKYKWKLICTHIKIAQTMFTLILTCLAKNLKTMRVSYLGLLIHFVSWNSFNSAFYPIFTKCIKSNGLNWHKLDSMINWQFLNLELNWLFSWNLKFSKLNQGRYLSILGQTKTKRWLFVGLV